MPPVSLCTGFAEALCLTFTVSHTSRRRERREQIHTRDRPLNADDDTLNNAPQQFFLVTSQQRFISCTQFCNDGQHIIQSVDISLGSLV
jgi:hypothetical protein